MKVAEIWIGLVCCTFIRQIHGNIDNQEYFCGRKLVRTLTELCSIYNHPSRYGPNRIRRQIIEECCRAPCSRRYLLQYYCSQAHSSVSKLLKASPDITKKQLTEKEETYPKPPSLVRTENKVMIVGTNSSQNSPGGHNNLHNINKIRDGDLIYRKRREKQKIRKIKTKPVPPPNIGFIEHSQKPFYIWRFPNY